MEVHFTPEQEAQLAQIATNAGTDTEHLVKDAALRLLAGNDDTPKAPQATRVNPLPVWHLGVVGSLHRRDIYPHPDLVLALPALHHELTVVTRDRSDFEKSRARVRPLGAISSLVFQMGKIWDFFPA
jgi:predicted nucleic acid-binding protein